MFMTVKPFRTKKITKVAAIQMCSTHLLDENLKTAESFILEASRNNAKLIVLPEMFGIFGKKSIDINLKMAVSYTHLTLPTKRIV